MATLDRDNDALVVRIVYDGPPTSGKTTSLRALAARFGQKSVVTPAELGGRTLFFDWLEYTGGRFEGRAIHCQILSAPGQKALSARRNLLLASADSVVFVADSSEPDLAGSLPHLDNLLNTLKTSSLPVGVVLQANKRDVPGAASLDPLRGRYNLAVVESVASEGDGVREAFVFAVRLALDRVREQLRRGELHSCDPETDPVGKLLGQMQSLPIDPLGDALWEPARSASAPEVHPLSPVPAPADGPRAPRLPDATVYSGCVWPPVQGRVLLQEAWSGAPPELTEVGDGSWVADSAGGWRFHSAAESLFSNADEARDALIAWAHQHTTQLSWLSAQRCLAVCETGDGGYRLWQIVRTQKSLWSLLTEAVASGDNKRMAEAIELCRFASERWSQAPATLPCTLESVAGDAGSVVFVGLMPPPGAVLPSADPLRHIRLSRQAEALVASEGSRQQLGS